jgi:hypothetical protein
VVPKPEPATDTSNEVKLEELDNPYILEESTDLEPDLEAQAPVVRKRGLPKLLLVFAGILFLVLMLVIVGGCVAATTSLVK